MQEEDRTPDFNNLPQPNKNRWRKEKNWKRMIKREEKSEELEENDKTGEKNGRIG